MRVVRLNSETASPAQATVIENLRTGSLYFNIWHGRRAQKLWSYVCSLNHKFFSPRTVNDVLELNNNNYILKPVMKKGVCVKDTRGNELYCITIDNDPGHKQDILLFWEIPNFNFVDVTYKHSVKAALLGAGASGKIRGNNEYISPYPVLEIVGECVLSWRGKDSQGNVYSQTIEVNPKDKLNTFKINEIVKEEAANDDKKS